MPGRYCIAAPEVSTRTLGEEGAVLFHPDTAKERHLNVTGLFLWERLDGSRREEDLVAELSRAFQDAPPHEVGPQVSSFLESLVEEGFALFCQGPAAGERTVRTFPGFDEAPATLDLSLTGKCNLRCSYCFYAHEMAARPDLPAQEWIRFFEELKGLAVRDLCLSGGEVFIREDLWDLIDAAVEGRMRYSILTNGTLITERTLEELEKGRRRQRLSSIQVSIDGSSPEVHDRSRGRGSFQRAVRGLRLLKEGGLPVTCRVTVNRYNVDDLENIARFLLDEVGLASFSTNDAMPMGAGCQNQESITLTPEQNLRAMRILAELADRYNGRVTGMAGPLARWRTYCEMEHARATGQMATRWRMGYLTACGCVFNKLAVHQDGTIVPCNMLPELVLGRINRDSVREIWRGHPTLKALKERRSIPMEEVPGCEDCQWAPYCNGSCPGLAYELTGDFNRANPRDCYRNFLASVGGSWR